MFLTIYEKNSAAAILQSLLMLMSYNTCFFYVYACTIHVYVECAIDIYTTGMLKSCNI